MHTSFRKIIFILILTLTLFANGAAHAKESKPVIADLGNLDRLIAISQDLSVDTKVFISINSTDDERSCYCSCRESHWSCTSNSCDKQNEECSNEDEE